MTPASKRPLYAALLLYFALTAALIARVPLALSPDEPAHWQYVEHIAQIGQLPVFTGAAPPAPGYEFHQPPLYYGLCAPGWKLLGAGAQNYWCRVVSMGCGLATICIIWSAARLLFPLKPRVPALAALFAALFPLHQAVGAGSNNDSLAGLIAAALFYLMARMSRGLTRRDVWQFGLVAGLAILTKNTLLVLVFSGFIALIWSSKKPKSQVPMLPALGSALLVAGVVGGPWLARNQLLYGDVLALGAFSKAAKAAALGFPVFAQAGMSFLTYARGLVWIAFLSAWGFFGGANAAVKASSPLSASGPHLPQGGLAPLVAMCLMLPLLAAWGWWRGAASRAMPDQTMPVGNGKIGNAPVGNAPVGNAPVSDARVDAVTVDAVTVENAPVENAPVGREVWGFWALGGALLFLAWAQFAFQFFAGAQARYLHPVLLPFCVFIAGGMERLFAGRALQIAGALWGASLLILTLLNVLVWRTFTD